MAGIAKEWLLGVVLSERRATRAHGANLDTIKTLYEREIGLLNQMTTTIVSAALSLAAGLLLAIFAHVTREDAAALEGSSEVVDLERMTFDDADRMAVIAIAVLLIVTVAAIIANRLLHQRYQQAYLRVVYVYYALSRVIP